MILQLAWITLFAELLPIYFVCIMVMMLKQVLPDYL